MQNNRLFHTLDLSTVPFVLFCMIWIGGAVPSIARAYCRLTTDSPPSGECVDTGIPLYWECGYIDYAVCPHQRDDLSFDDIISPIEKSFQSWQDVQCEGEGLGFEFLRHDDPDNCDQHYRFKQEPDFDFSPHENLIIFVKDWEDFGYAKKAFAQTYTWHKKSTGVIVGFDIELNQTIGFGICGNDPEQCAGAADIQNVVTHEIGHALGLGHTSDEDATMFDESEPGDTNKRTLKDDDIEGICSILMEDSVADCWDTKKTRSDCSVGRVGSRNRDLNWNVLVSFLIAFILIHHKLR